MATKKEFADHVGITVAAVNLMIRKGVLPATKSRGAEIDIDTYRLRYCEYLRGVAMNRTQSVNEDEDSKPKKMGRPPSSPDSDINVARAKNLEADTRLKELKERQMRDEIAEIEVIEQVLGDMAVKVCAVLEALPMALRRRFPDLNSAQIDLIRSEIVKARNAAADLQTGFAGINIEERGDHSPVGEPGSVEVQSA